MLNSSPSRSQHSSPEALSRGGGGHCQDRLLTPGDKPQHLQLTNGQDRLVKDPTAVERLSLNSCTLKTKRGPALWYKEQEREEGWHAMNKP